uniref:LEM domain-containing protein 2 n=1 Tax=Latimeria chalumnae TaxID=7897 RepID=H3BA22_LATCH
MASLTAEDLRKELKFLGFSPGPITDSTRKLYVNKLNRLRHEHKLRLRGLGFRRPEKSLQEALRPSRTLNHHQQQHLHSSLFQPTEQLQTWRRELEKEEDTESESDDEKVYVRTEYKKKPQRSCDVEFYLSWALYVTTLGLLLVFLGVVYLKTVGMQPSQEISNNIQMLPVDCKGKTDVFCQAEEKKILMQLLSDMYNFLSKIAGDFECGIPTEQKSRCIPLADVKNYLAVLNSNYLENLDDAMEWMIESNLDLGIQLVGKEPGESVTSADGVWCLESASPQMSFGCRLHRALISVLHRMFVAVLGLIILWGGFILLKYRWRKMEEEEQAMFEMVKKILAVVEDHYKDWEQDLEHYPYVSIPHVRDSLIPPQKRRRSMRRIWDKAMEFLASNESRIRTETHRIAGEDFLMWRWIKPS